MPLLENISGCKNIINIISKLMTQHVNINPQLPSIVLSLDISGAKSKYLNGKTLSRSIKLARI